MKNNDGFLTTVHRYSGSPGLDEFVLKPNSIGKITMSYLPVSNANTTEELISNIYQKSPSEFFADKIQNISKVTSGQDLESVNAQNVGVGIIAENITKVAGSNGLQVTYVVNASPDAEKGTYLVGLWQTCPGELLTIGEKPYEGIMPWDQKVYH